MSRPAAAQSILVIDEHPVSRLILEDELDAIDGDLVFAADAREGLRQARASGHRLILVDLPAASGKDALDLINELKVGELTRDTPVAIVTGMDSKTEIERAKKAGVEEVFIKPFRPGQLAAWVRSNFDGHSDGRRSSHILLVEDSETIRAITTYLLEKNGHTVLHAPDGLAGWEALNAAPDAFDMILTDINMPRMDGRELVEKIRGDARFQFIPIIVSTTISEKENIKRLLNTGADDYIVKPFSSEEFVARIGSQLRVKSLYEELRRANEKMSRFNMNLEQRVRERTQDLRQANIDAILSLAVAAEAKDDSTGNHVYRIQSFCEALARKMGLAEAVVEDIGYSSIMHDVGKISIPDHILKKPGRLTGEEFVIMKGHSLHGERILPSRPFFETARQIARSHHERWDGAGYPDRLAGKGIPLAARICSVADVFDALVAKRCYKEAWSMDDAQAEILRCAGSQFDPEVVEAWDDLFRAGEIELILMKWQERESEGGNGHE
ncbi:MAG: response regulator [Nitrospinae bacterium]|nr:response regulator [Nitrospinota bacterium]